MAAENLHTQTPNSGTETPPKLLTSDLICRFYLPAAKRTMRRWISAGLFPKPDIALGGKVRYWKRETIERWIDEQANGGSHE